MNSSPENQVNLILDSGAYSLWKKGEVMEVSEYVDFIHKQGEGVVKEVVNLDVIPGSWGVIPSPSEVEASAAKGWKNALALRKAGINPMPVFHMGERRYWLERMIGEGFNYIGISPANDRTTEQKIEWLDEMFGFMCGRAGFPPVKTHAFGATALPILYRYPWWSADSVTWLLVGGYGAILVPVVGADGLFDYSQSPEVISVSDRAKAGAWSGDKHFKALGPRTQAYVRKYIDEEGFNFEKLATDYVLRQRVNCRFFVKAAASYDIRPFRPKHTSLFNHHKDAGLGQEKPISKHLRFVFTITTSPQHSDILQDEGCKNRLVTYYYFRGGAKVFDLKTYVQTGRIHGKPWEPKKKRVKVKDDSE